MGGRLHLTALATIAHRAPRRLIVGAAVGGLALPGCGSANTFQMDCFAFMHSTTAIDEISNSQRNQDNWYRCQSANQENTVLTWDKGNNFGR
jgi:hypothetical protein